MNKIFDLFTKSVSKPSLPLPEGPFQVGHVDVMTPGSPQEDGSFFRLHYPAPAHTKVGHCQKLLTPQAFLSTFNAAWKAIGKSLTIPTVLGAAMEPPLEQEGWPVVVFSHGMGCNSYFVLDGEGFRSSHQVKHEEVFLDKEYERRNEQLNQRSHEIRKVIDVLAKLQAGQTIVNVVDDVDSHNVDLKFLTSSLDLKNNLHLLGHSFGGSSVMLAAWQDPRVDSILALDPWMFPLAKQEFKIDKPTTVVNTEKFLNDDNIAVIKRATCKEITVKWKVQESGV